MPALDKRFDPAGVGEARLRAELQSMAAVKLHDAYVTWAQLEAGLFDCNRRQNR